MAIHQIPACCTASLVHSFYGQTHFDEPAIDESISSGLRLRQAIVQAYTTAAQGETNKLLVQKGFVKVADVVDYKYPDTSKRLFLWVLDLNTKKDQPVVATPPVNPFTPVAAPVVRRVQPPRPRLQNGRFMPAVGVEFTVDFARPIPESWDGVGFEILNPITQLWYRKSRTALTMYRLSTEFPETVRRIRRIS